MTVDSYPHLLAGILCVLLVFAHSIIGQRRFFADDKMKAYRGRPGIVWASWHAVSLFGLAFAALFLNAGVFVASVRVPVSIGISALGTAVLVLYATHGRHLGWFALILISLLAFLG